jgi:hypothetical protein
MRKSAIVTLLASSLVVLSGVTGRAGTLWDIDLFFKYLSGLSNQTASYTDSFNINGKYDPALERVTNAQAWFLVEDDERYDGVENVQVDLAGDRFRVPSNAGFNLGVQISGDALLTLATTGTLQYTFRSAEGDFDALAAKLWVETSPRGVPDGGATLMLLGVALAGIESLRRRMARRNAQPKTA